MLECNNKFRCTALQIQEFVDGHLWQDILQELSNWENRLMEELAAPTFDATTGQMAMGRAERVLYDEMLRGCIKAIDNMRMLPFIIQEIVEQTKPEKQHVNETDSAAE